MFTRSPTGSVGLGHGASRRAADGRTRRDRVRGRTGARDRRGPGAVAARADRRTRQWLKGSATHRQRARPGVAIGHAADLRRVASRNPIDPNASRDPSVRDGRRLAVAGPRCGPACTDGRPRAAGRVAAAPARRGGPGADPGPVPGRPHAPHRHRGGSRLQCQYRTPPTFGSVRSRTCTAWSNCCGGRCRRSRFSTAPSPSGSSSGWGASSTTSCAASSAFPWTSGRIRWRRRGADVSGAARGGTWCCAAPRRPPGRRRPGSRAGSGWWAR